MKLLDANVVLYALGEEHEYRVPCRVVMDRILGGGIDVATNSEMLQEILYVYRRQDRLDDAVGVTRRMSVVLVDILAVDGRTILMACDLLTRHRRLQSRDAIHAATVFQHNLEGIISTDRGFDAVAGLKRFDPKELAA